MAEGGERRLEGDKRWLEGMGGDWRGLDVMKVAGGWVRGCKKG